ncbi:MAG: hypothetical protein NDI73_06535 [Desulfuromonadales bacterium]|nr:hypothetical protein [Desulfuromonadales bacterium]
MTTDKNDNVDSVVAFVSGAIIGVAVTLLFVRMQGKCAIGSKTNDEDYYYDGGDLFV